MSLLRHHECVETFHSTATDYLDVGAMLLLQSLAQVGVAVCVCLCPLES